MKTNNKIFFLIAIFTLLLILIIYKKCNFEFKYYKQSEYRSQENSILISQALQNHFYYTYNLKNYEKINLDSTFAHFGWMHNLQLPNEQGLYIVKTKDSIFVCTQGFDKARGNKIVKSKDLNIFNYLNGVDIVLFANSNIYNICDIRPWDHRWFIKGVFNEDQIMRSKMNELSRNLLKVRIPNYSKNKLTKVLFYGKRNTNNNFEIQCVCGKNEIDSSILNKAIRVLQISSSCLNVDEYYLPTSLPKK